MGPSKPRSRAQARVIVFTMAGSLALAACGASAGTALPSPSTAPPSASPSVAASPSPAASPSASGASIPADRTDVSGRMDGGAVREDEAKSRLYFEFTYTMSDPRVSGTEKIDCTQRFSDLTDSTIGAGVGLWWDCSAVLTAQGGTWKGLTGYGSEYMKGDQLRTNGTNIYEGQGAFAGLRYVTLFTGSPETNALYGEGYVIAGWIEPAQ